MAERVYLDEIQRYKADPDDTIVVRVKGRLTHAQCERIRHAVRLAFPDQRAIVLDEGASLRVIKPSCCDEC